MPGHHAEAAVSCPDAVLADTFHQIRDSGSVERIGTQIVTISVVERRRQREACTGRHAAVHLVQLAWRYVVSASIAADRRGPSYRILVPACDLAEQPSAFFRFDAGRGIADRCLDRKSTRLNSSHLG